MSGVTDNYGLILPAQGEPYDVDIVNANNKQIDDILKNNTGKPFAHMGRTNAFQGPIGATSTVVQMDEAQETKGGFVFDNASDSLVIPKTGRYNTRIKGFFTGNAAEINQAGIWLNGAAAPNGPYQAVTLSANKQGGGDIFPHSSATLSFKAGDKVGIWVITGSHTWGTNGYDGSFIELEWAGNW